MDTCSFFPVSTKAYLFKWKSLFLVGIVLLSCISFFVGQDHKATAPSWQSLIISVSVVTSPLLLISLVYFVLKGRWIYASILLCVLFLTFLAPMFRWSYFSFYPLIHTVHSSKFTVERFEKIRIGMTKKQVESFIGDRPSRDEFYNPAREYDSKYCDPLGRCDSCEMQTGRPSGRNGGFAHFQAEVCYDNDGRVVKVEGGFRGDPTP